MGINYLGILTICGVLRSSKNRQVILTSQFSAQMSRKTLNFLHYENVNILKMLLHLHILLIVTFFKDYVNVKMDCYFVDNHNQYNNIGSL